MGPPPKILGDSPHGIDAYDQWRTQKFLLGGTFPYKKLMTFFLVISHVFHFQFLFSCCKIRTNFHIFSCLRGAHALSHSKIFANMHKIMQKFFFFPSCRGRAHAPCAPGPWVRHWTGLVFQMSSLTISVQAVSADSSESWIYNINTSHLVHDVWHCNVMIF